MREDYDIHALNPRKNPYAIKQSKQEPINMHQKPTDELDKQLENTKPEQLAGYYKENDKYMPDDEKGFYYYMKDVIESKNILLKDIYLQAGVSEKYGSKILFGEKHTKNRDLIIRLCIAGHFSLNEINRALKIYEMSPLYSKDRRDAAIIVAVNNRKYDMDEIDDILQQQGLDKLSKDE